ncbi:site-specific DNA-methyltransferase (adenine-specific) [Candidatus Electrothrix laxa]
MLTDFLPGHQHLVITNSYEWFIFNATTFDRLFAQNKKLVKQFNDFENGRLVDTKTDFFYKQIAEPFIEDIKTEIDFTYFNLQEYQKLLRNDDKADDNKLIALFKLLSPEHLLKLPFTNDSNSLDKRFYSELLHIIGLTETKEGSKKLIERNKPGERFTGTLFEDTIIQLDSLDKLSRLERPSQFGSTQQEKLFNVALELSITWINRILFLKLLEAQLITYHKGDKSYSFLNLDKIKNYDDLNSLFFQVLAKKHDQRNEDVIKAFEKVPYLNSSLFEPTDIEQDTIFISNLRDDKTIPILSQTVLKDQQGKKRIGKLKTLEYLFEFLNAYDFSSEGSEEIQEENKSLINASVLGLIFEKINGYKDGSFFTPGFITMYMCRETIRKAVVQKFNETKNWKCKDLEDLYDKIEDRKEANDIVNRLKICDPAVGSGHFLVSALNEMIAVKNDLKILQDRDGKRLKEYQVEIVNDELIVTDEEGELFDYNFNSKESQRIQETLFHEKQTIIENCLFGVDINPNSVKICRLRLWIELLKNAYYKTASELETLPNIDINIKCGNSLVSRFSIDADLKQALKKSNWSIDSYRVAVETYRNAQNKEQKREMKRLIADIKSDFRSEISLNDPKVKNLYKLSGKLYQMTHQRQLFEMSKKEKVARDKKVKKLTEDTKKLKAEIEEIKANKIFENAFEWRFEFPEVLNADGDFVGFDVVIGNPPYIGIEDIAWDYRRFYETIFKTATGRFDLYSLFIEKAMRIKHQTGVFTYIIPGKFLNNKQFVTARKIVCDNQSVTVVKIYEKVFEDAQVDSVIVENFPAKNKKYKALQISMHELQLLSETDVSNILSDKEIIFRLEINIKLDNLISKIQNETLKIKEIGDVKDGIVAGTIKDILYIDKKIDKDCHKLYFGKHLSRYSLAETSVWVNYKPEEMMKEEVQRKNGKRAGLWMRDEKIFNREKILSRFVAKEIIATYDNEGKYYEHTLHSTHITDERFKIKYVLGLFNSNLFKFYYRKTNSQGGDIFPQVRISSVNNLPIKLADNKTQGKIEALVNQILAKTLQDNLSETKDLENQIDQLVYDLYDLTKEEIELIENAK